jgi:hypothetical protein
MLINYQKRKNLELFNSLAKPDSLFMSEMQNFIPIYTRFFSLNDTNYNGINLNHEWYISDANKFENDNNIYKCKVKNTNNNKQKEVMGFFKMAPLLDPYKYLIGKYNVNDDRLFVLPQLTSSDLDCNAKFVDPNNSAYVDGFFTFLTSGLKQNHKFSHGIDYYGSFLGIKNDFMFNVYDDIDYLNNSDFFNKNKNLLFKIDDYDHLIQNENPVLKPIKIHTTSAMSQLSAKSFNNEIFDNVFEENTIGLDNLKENDINLSDLADLVDLTDSDMLDNKSTDRVSLKSNSTCSSRSSYTNDSTDGAIEDEDVVEVCQDGIKNNDANSESEEHVENNSDDSGEWEDDDSDEEEERINATIPKFPVQVISMECCENTFDDLILKNVELSNEEWFSALMQIIMILITYQKAFNLTHNDLHTNNVMYNHTNKKFIYYCYKKKYYKVPTFGRLFKIIDFGRSIYKFNGKLFCSDSFQTGGDAATQYNTEPYLNEKKPRLEPNYSFDLCRLACSIFDYVVEDTEEINKLSKCADPVKRLIVEWCLDDKGINMLYKNNGTDRYPDFKLYKMIARCVHNHTPQAQLERPEFNAFSDFKGAVPDDVIDIDSIPSYV